MPSPFSSSSSLTSHDAPPNSLAISKAVSALATTYSSSSRQGVAVPLTRLYLLHGVAVPLTDNSNGPDLHGKVILDASFELINS